MNRGIRIVIAILAIVLGLVGIVCVVLSAYHPKWERFDTEKGTVGLSELRDEILEDGGKGEDVKGSAVEATQLYSQKYGYAVEEVKGIAEMTEYVVILDISEQKEYVFGGEGEFIDVYKVSTGSSHVVDRNSPDPQNRAMQESVWRIALKRDWAPSEFYGPRIMVLDRYIGGTWITTEVALHGTEEPENLGLPVSLGCVYHDNADIIELFDLVSVGTLVVAMK